MLPTLNLGALHLNTYWMLYILATVLAGSLTFWRYVRGGVPAARVAGLAQWIIAGGLLGSFVLAGLVLSLCAYLVTGRLTWPGGSGFMGLLVGSCAGAWLGFRRYGIPVRRGFDLGILYLPLGQAIGRLGCLAEGCCYGAPTTSWLGLYLPDVSGAWTQRYPAPLMAATADVGIFVLLLAWERHVRRTHRSHGWPFQGFIFLLYVEIYALKRFALEFLRADHPGLPGALTMVHGLTLVVMLAAGVVAYCWVREARPEGQGRG